jgi:hypothetical protein
MFGPLNGVRTILVVGAGICAVVALLVGYPIVTVILVAGIGAHGALWWWMYRHRPGVNDPPGPI